MSDVDYEGISFAHAGVRIDSDRTKLANLVANLTSDSEFRARFERDPAGALKQAGIELSQEVAARMAGRSLSKLLAQGGDPLSQLLPGETEHAVGADSVAAVGPVVVVVAAAAVAVASTPAVVKPKPKEQEK
jgi:putative modified peptide